MGRVPVVDLLSPKAWPLDAQTRKLSTAGDNLDIMSSAAFSGLSLAVSRNSDRISPGYRAEHQSNTVASSIHQLRPTLQQSLADVKSIPDHY